MLADSQVSQARTGALAPGVQRPGASREALFRFIAQELPRWRDDPLRREATAEEALTEQLCRHLNHVANDAPGWDSYQFQPEAIDEQRRQRRLDMAVAPRGTALLVEGRTYTHYDIVLPIECKCLPPVPRDKRRDEREYVHVDPAKRGGGGIQRFKSGDHAGAHDFAGMIGYLHSDTPEIWQARIDGWIRALAQAGGSGWSEADCLRLVGSPPAGGVTELRSSHCRQGGRPPIALCHLWLRLERAPRPG